MTRRILSLWLPEWHTQLWFRRHPDTPTTLPLVLHIHESRRQMVIAANSVARSAGITSGMALAAARSLYPDLLAVPATPAQDTIALTNLAAWCLWASPLVAIDPPDGIWIETTGCDHLFGGETALLETLRDRLNAFGYTVRAAIADTAGAAHAIARHGRDPLVAAFTTIDPLPIAALRLDPHISAGLDRMGIHRIADLRVTPRAPLTRRFGPEPLRQLDRALGHLSEPLSFLIPRDALTAQRTFIEPISTAENIATVITHLAEELCTLLEQRGQGARQLDLLCARVDGITLATRIGTSAPARDPTRLTRLLTDRIDTIEPGFGIEAMTLRCDRAETMRSAPHEHTLLSTDHGSAALAGLIDRLRNHLGPHAVFALAPAASHIPERTQSRQAGPARIRRIATPLFPRPARLLDPPEPIDVMTRLPEGTPRHFVWRKTRRCVAGADGPERLHGEWWLTPGEAGLIRDYWTVETEPGERFWLFRRGDGTHPWSGDGAWFLHGVF